MHKQITKTVSATVYFYIPSNKFVIIATGDSTVSITSIDRSTKTHPLLSNDTLVIPNTFIHNGYEYQVEGIEDNAFIGCKDIKHLIISEGIDYIGENAFRIAPNSNPSIYPVL